MFTLSADKKDLSTDYTDPDSYRDGFSLAGFSGYRLPAVIRRFKWHTDDADYADYHGLGWCF